MIFFHYINMNTLTNEANFSFLKYHFMKIKNLMFYNIGLQGPRHD